MTARDPHHELHDALATLRAELLRAFRIPHLVAWLSRKLDRDA